MIFRGTAGINLPVYDMFVIDGPLIQTTQAECQTIHTTSCNTHYRNPLLQRWNKLNIHHVSSVYTSFSDINYELFVFYNTKVKISIWHVTIRNREEQCMLRYLVNDCVSYVTRLMQDIISIFQSFTSSVVLHS